MIIPPRKRRKGELKTKHVKRLTTNHPTERKRELWSAWVVLVICCEQGIDINWTSKDPEEHDTNSFRSFEVIRI